MKNQRKAKGLLFTGRVPKSNVTIYYRNGDFVVRPAHSEGKRSNTSKQFVQRQRMRHSIALWKALKPCQPLFTSSSRWPTACQWCSCQSFGTTVPRC